VIKLTNLLDRLFQFLVIAHPSTNLGNPLTTHAELSRASTPITDRQHVYLMAFPPRAFRATTLMTNDPLQHRPAQQVARDRQLLNQFLARSKGAFANHPRK